MLTLWAPLILFPSTLLGEEEELRNEDIEITHDEEQTIFEYRQNGVLRIIKIVPKKGRPYYMIPVDANARFEGLEHAKKLYPQWVVFEW
jgi:hypothetical protein|tara:strand:+ start:4600 stop:4866 length:267 start_codon:yes stop_codon:yes gene_type:complete